MTEHTTKPVKAKGFIKIAAIGLIALFVMVFAALVIGHYWLLNFAQTPQASIKEQLFEVKRGDTVRAVLARLDKKKIIEQPLAYRLMLMREPALTRLKVAHYRLTDDMSPHALFTLLSSGVEAQFSVTLVEGTTFAQWIETIQQQQYIDKTPLTDKQYQSINGQYVEESPIYPYANVEGLLYPDTYHFSANSAAIDIFARAKKRLALELNKQWDMRQANLPLKTPYEALILASIIEKETGIAAERKTIASVFVNRLRKGMRLQTDPTVIYGVGKDYAGDITRAHLRDKTPYNTYRINGLPPTPIAMVSKESLIAALNPAQTPYYYFVAAGDGSHYFSKTLSEHNKAVRRYLSLTKNK